MYLSPFQVLNTRVLTFCESNEPVKLSAIIKKAFTKQSRKTELTFTDPLTMDVEWNLDTFQYLEYKIRSFDDCSFQILDKQTSNEINIKFPFKSFPTIK